MDRRVDEQPADTMPHPGSQAFSALIEDRGESDTIWRTAHATRAHVVVDAADYFDLVQAAMINAKQRIMLIGWDFDTRINLIAWLRTQGSGGFAIPAPDPTRQPGAAAPRRRCGGCPRSARMDVSSRWRLPCWRAARSGSGCGRSLGSACWRLPPTRG